MWLARKFKMPSKSQLLITDIFKQISTIGTNNPYLTIPSPPTPNPQFQPVVKLRKHRRGASKKVDYALMEEDSEEDYISEEESEDEFDFDE